MFILGGFLLIPESGFLIPLHVATPAAESQADFPLDLTLSEASFFCRLNYLTQ